MKILLTSLNSKYIHTNLAIRILKNDLSKHNISCDMKEFNIKHDFNELALQLKEYDLIALSCYIFNINQTKKLTTLLKKINPKVIIVLGGPEVSYLNKEQASELIFDYIICGEGEKVLVSLIKDIKNNKEISNEYIISKKNNKIILNTRIHKIMDNYFYDLTNDFLNIDLENQIVYVETSRGCPYGCFYCLASLDNDIRNIPLDMLFKKLDYLLNNKAKIIKFLDRTFNFNINRTNQILDYLITNDNNYTVFQFEITGELLDDSSIELINTKARKGQFRFEIGIQSTNKQANLEIGRYQDFESLKNVIQKINKGNKVALHLDLIAGLPFEDLASFKKTFNDVYKLNGLELQLGILKLLKGTKMNDLVLKHEYVFKTDAPYELIKNKYLSSEDLDIIEIVEKGLNNFYNQQKARLFVDYILKNKYIEAFDLYYKLGLIVTNNNNQIYDLYNGIFNSTLVENDDDIICLLENYYLINKNRPKPLTNVKNKKVILHQFCEKYNMIQNEVFSHTIVEQINYDTYFLKSMNKNKSHIIKINMKEDK